MSKSNREVNRRERAAAIQAAQARAERNRRVALIGAVIVVVSIVAVAVFWYSSGSGGSGTAASGKSYGKVPARIVDLTGAPAKTVAASGSSASPGGTPGLVIGKPTAKVKVVVYEDFLCPYCREFEESTRDFLHAAAAKGKVEVEYRPFHLLPEHYSTDALNAFYGVLKSSKALAALKFHDSLYDNQPYETASSFPDAAKLAQWAKAAGADGASAQTAVTAGDPTFQKAMDALAKASGLTGTPTIFVNGRQLQGASISAMADNLETTIDNS